MADLDMISKIEAIKRIELRREITNGGDNADYDMWMMGYNAGIYDAIDMIESIDPSNEIIEILNEIKAKITNAQYESAFPLDIEHANSIIDEIIKRYSHEI